MVEGIRLSLLWARLPSQGQHTRIYIEALWRCSTVWLTVHDDSERSLTCPGSKQRYPRDDQVRVSNRIRKQGEHSRKPGLAGKQGKKRAHRKVESGTPLQDTLVGHSCRTLLWNSLVGHSCATLWHVTLAGHSCCSLVGHSCKALL